MSLSSPPRSLPRSTPAGQQADPAAILAFLDAVESRPDIEMHSLMVVRHGQVITEGWWAPYGADRRHFLYSLSKSFTSTAAGFARAEGLLDLDDPVVKHFPEFEADITDPRSRAIRVRHVAAMASGHNRDMRGEALDRDPEEPVRGFLLIPPDQEPGTLFEYSQPCTYTLGSIVQRNSGLSLTEYLRPRLFDPLGIGPVGWQTWPPGRQQGFSGLFARTEDIAKLGLLYLQGGRWDGRQLLPADWVAQATTQQVANPDRENPDWRQGYGFQFWMSRHGYRGDGAFGQFCVVLPEQDTVVAITAATWDMQAVLDALWAHLLPGLGASGDGAAQEELSARLTRLALPACPAGRGSGGRSGSGRGSVPGRGRWRGAGHDPGLGVTGASGRRLGVTLSEADNAVTFGPARARGRCPPRLTSAAARSRSQPRADGSTAPCGWRSSSWRRRTGWTSSCTRTATPPPRPGGSRPCSRATWPTWPVPSCPRRRARWGRSCSAGRRGPGPAHRRGR